MGFTESEAKAMFGRTYPGVVDAVHYTGAPQNGGYAASQITYDVWVNMDTGPVLITNITPHSERPAETVNTTPARISSPVIVMSVGGKLVFWMHEYPAWSTCS